MNKQFADTHSSGGHRPFKRHRSANVDNRSGTTKDRPTTCGGNIRKSKHYRKDRLLFSPSFLPPIHLPQQLGTTV